LRHCAAAKAEPRNESEQHHENDESGPVYILHGVPPQAWLFVADGSRYGAGITCDFRP